jgi:hypothetical protein
MPAFAAAGAGIRSGPFGSIKGICEIARNEKAVKSLKINNSAKFVIQR